MKTVLIILVIILLCSNITIYVKKDKVKENKIDSTPRSVEHDAVSNSDSTYPFNKKVVDHLLSVIKEKGVQYGSFYYEYNSRTNGEYRAYLRTTGYYVALEGLGEYTTRPTSWLEFIRGIKTKSNVVIMSTDPDFEINLVITNSSEIDRIYEVLTDTLLNKDID